MTATPAQALTEMTLLLTAGVAFPVIVPNDERDPPNGTDTVWARLKFEHTNGMQATLSDQAGVRRWRADGIGTVELNLPYGKGVKYPYEVAETVCNLYRGKRTASDVWFRNVRIAEVPTEGNARPKYYRLDVVFEFQYDSVN